MGIEVPGDTSHSGSGEPVVRLEPDRGWKDLILPGPQIEELRRICDEFRRRNLATAHRIPTHINGAGIGLKVLLVGEPGTGKTTATRVLGWELGLSISRVDLRWLAAGGQQEADRALQQVLSTAQPHRTILLLDSADAVVGKRSPAADPRRGEPGLSPADLVRRLDAHSGLIVVAARLKSSLDHQLLERLDYEVDFPFPQAPARERIWRLRLPRDAALDAADFEFMADSFKLSGAAIDGCAEFATRQASAEGVAVGLRHIAQGLELEYGNRLVGAQTRAAIERIHAMVRSGPSPPEAAEPEPALGMAEAEPALRARSPRRSREPQRPAEPSRAIPAGGGRRPTSPGLRLALLALGGALIAGLLGVLAARALTGSGSSPQPLNQRASAGLMRVAFPTGWRREVVPASPALGLSDELALVPASRADGLLLIGSARTTDRSLLPASLAHAIPHLGPAQLTTLNGLRYYRYLDQTVRGLPGTASLYARPAAGGTVLAVCVTRAPASAFAGVCERIVGTVRSGPAAAPAVAATTGYVAGLTAAMAKLGTAQSTAGRALARARTNRVQAAAADTLASANYRAAAAVAKLSAGPARPANLALASALRSTGSAYRVLSSAAARHDARGYARARSAVSAATARITAAISALSKLGNATS